MANPPPSQSNPELTEREQEILRLLATGTSNKDIAARLFISTNTVRVHLRNIFAKTGTSSRTEAAMYAVHTGIVASTPSTENPDSSSSTASPETMPPETGKPGLRLRRLLIWAFILVVLVGAAILGSNVLQQPAVSPTPTWTSLPTSTPEPRWNARATLPVPLEGLAVAAFEEKIYVIGGETEAGVTGLVEKYDPSADGWVKLKPKPLPVTQASAAVLGGKVYVPGGLTASGKVTDRLEVYDPELDTWSEGPALPTGICAYALVAFEGRLYLFGGWDGNKYINNVYIYLPGSISWQKGQHMPTARRNAGAAVVQGKVYVVGGENASGELAVNEVESLVPGGNGTGWQAGLPLPLPASSISLVNVADLVYALVSQGETHGIYVLQLNADTHEQEWAFMEMPFEFGQGFGAVLVGTKLYVMGGSSGEQPIALNAAYNAIYTIVLPITK